ncbi:MAG: sensor domain-containing diguanylate cyclase [Thiovulaceae bacterium]|nr:sensor domain-containing diguanylate cyclase [Sulfurimonadaceae bacterium]
MRCNLLYCENSRYDISLIKQELAYLEYNVTVRAISDKDDLDTVLREQSFDLFLVDDDAQMLTLALEIKGIYLPYKLCCLYVMRTKDADLKIQLKELGASQVVFSVEKDEALAHIIDLTLQQERSKTELSTMGSYMRDASLVFEREGDNYKIVYVNKAFLNFDGLKQEDLTGILIEDAQSDFNLVGFLDDIKEVDATGVPVHMPNYYFTKDDEREWCDVYIFKPNSGQVSLIASPQTEIKRTHDQAEASRRYLQTILNAQTHIIYITDGLRLININKAFLDFFGFTTMHEFVKQTPCVSDVFELSDETGYIDKNDKNWLEDVANAPEDINKIRIKKDDAIIVFIPSVQIVMINEKKQYVVILTDITELEFEKEKLRIVAMTDPLTGAGNRSKFNTMIDEQLAIARRYTTELSIIIFDVDHFKQINDQFGHQTGDEVLKRIVSIVKNEIRESDLLIRWGGEEFLIVLPNTSLEHAELAAQKIRKSFDDEKFEDVKKVTCSFGCTTLKTEDTIASMIARADEAMYQAKKAGKNCVKVGI